MRELQTSCKCGGRSSEEKLASTSANTERWADEERPYGRSLLASPLCFNAIEARASADTEDGGGLKVEESV